MHRDLKPGNVLIDRAGQPKVWDFGLVRMSGEQSLTVTSEVVGTLEFMAPEQLDAAKAVDARADLYSLGAVLFALLTGPRSRAPGARS